MTTSRSSATRTGLLGLAAGVVLLVLLGGFAIGLPKVDGAGSAPSLPDTLPGGLRAVELVARDAANGGGQDAAQAQEFLSKQEEISDSAVKALEGQYDAPVALRAYQGDVLPQAQGQAQGQQQTRTQLTVTVIDAPAGPFLPQGPVPDPATYGAARGTYSLESIGDGRCSLAWAQAVPQGQPVDPDEVPQSVYCQVGHGERTYLGIGNGLTGQQVVDLLDGLAKG